MNVPPAVRAYFAAMERYRPRPDGRMPLRVARELAGGGPLSAEARRWANATPEPPPMPAEVKQWIHERNLAHFRRQLDGGARIVRAAVHDAKALSDAERADYDALERDAATKRAERARNTTPKAGTRLSTEHADGTRLGLNRR